MRETTSVILLILLTVATITACNSATPETNVAGSKKANQQLRLSFKPADSCTYVYNIVNKTTTTVEVPAGETETVNNSTSNVQYDLRGDSTGGYQLRITYKDIDVYLKKNGVESHMRAPSSHAMSEPAERLLASLVNTPITAKLNKEGRLIEIRGYDEMVNRVMSQLTGMNEFTRSQANQQLVSMIKEGLIVKNVDQMFSIFSDSVKSVGDKWSTMTMQKGEFPVHVQTEYELVEVQTDKAKIASTSTLTSDKSTVNIGGRNVQSKLTGEQEGTLTVDRKTGMLLHSTSTSTIEGEIIFEGRDMPITIEGKVDIRGSKL